MKTEIHSPSIVAFTKGFARFFLVVVGIILGQSALYGPCLLGRKILLPLDVLAQPYVYLPRTPGMVQVQQSDPTLCDQVFAFEPARRFAARELRAGRFPLWSPDYFGGAPCIWSTFSPFALLDCLTESPVIIAWKALATALVGGLGMYRFCREALHVGFWPACICAWCYPLTGFFVLWQGFYVRQTVCLLPWLLLGIDRTVRRTSRFSVVGLSLLTGLVCWGQLDIAGQMLLVSGLYAIWCFWDHYRRKWFSAIALRAAVGLISGWMLGLMLAAPQILPAVEYSLTGSRIPKRAEGREERPPAGLVALPHLFLPDYYGRTTHNSLNMVPYLPGNLQESAAGAYAGAVAMLFAAPLAFGSRQHRSMNIFLWLLSFLGIGWVLNLPIIVPLLRLPGLNLMSHNRLVFASSFGFIALAAVGFELLLSGAVPGKAWCRVMALPLVGLSCLCIYRATELPEPLATQSERFLSLGLNVQWLTNMGDLNLARQWFYCHSLISAFICATGAIFWLLLGFRQARLPRFFVLSGAVLLAELFWFAQGRQPACEHALYYPPVPALEAVAHAKPGRVIGFGCLPANLASVAGLRDIRGYNGVDPGALSDLLTLTTDPRSQTMSYSAFQNLAPKITLLPNGEIRLPRVLDLLNVRYIIFRGQPPPHVRPLFTNFDYYVLENTNVLSRVFVPRKVQALPNREARLAKLQSPEFDPRQIAFIETTDEFPADCRGLVEVLDEIPTRVRVKAEMDTAGLVVLADTWDKGWQAYLDRQRVPILRTDHALRGVAVPSGGHELEFRYESAPLGWGLRLAGLALMLVLAYIGIVWFRSRSITALLFQNHGSCPQSDTSCPPYKG